MRILGIDPGFERLGVAVIERNKTERKEVLVFSECFKTKASLKFEERLVLIGQEIRTIIEKYHPEALAIETLFLTTNQKTVMHVAEARGVVLYEAARASLEILEFSPPQIKTATTGYGKATKDQVQKMIHILVDVNPVRSREGSQRPSASNGTDDEMDAIAVALTGFAHMRP